MASAGKKKKGLLLVGLLLVTAGIIFVTFPASASLAEWLMRLWPVFLICAGVVRVMGYAIERKPRSPLGGMFLIIIGVLFLASRFHSDLNALQIYGRYWLLLLGVFAGVELLRFYSHRHTEGPPPRLFTPWRLIVIAFIVSTGVLANRVAGDNPSLLSALKLPKFLSGLRDSVVGDKYTFNDEPFVAQADKAGSKVTIRNSYGSVKVTGGSQTFRATLSKGVRAWSEEDARKIAGEIRLIVNQNEDGWVITTNREEINNQFTTDIQVEVPSSIALFVTNSYGSASATGDLSGVTMKVSYGRADVAGTNGDVNLDLTYSDAGVSNVNGDLNINGARRVKIADVSGSVELGANNGSIELYKIAGPAHVEAPFSSISAEDLSSSARIKTEHSSVRVARAADVDIEAPHSDVHAEDIAGDLKITSSHSKIDLHSIGGELTISADRSSVVTDNTEGPIDIKTSHGSVTVRNFYESVNIETSYRDVTLVSAIQPENDIEVENDHGAIKLVLPEPSQFYLDAASHSGQVRPIGFSNLPSRIRDSATVSLGSDGPVIKLRTSYRDITIEANKDRQEQADRAVN